MKIIIKFFIALVCLLLACLLGQVFMSWGIDNRGSSMPISPVVIYFAIVMFASPCWLFTFLPLYLGVGSKSFAWRWYIAPIFGLLFGFMSGLIELGAMNPDFPRISLAPMVIGFATFFFGAIFKKTVE